MSNKSAEVAGRATGATEQSCIKAAPAGTGTTVLAFHFSPPVPATAVLESSLRELQQSHPILRARLNPSPSSISINKDADIRLETLGAAATADILSGKSAGNDDDSRSPFHMILRHELNRNPWAGKSPDQAVFFATIYTLPSEYAVLAIRVHTMAADRTAVSSIARQLLGLIKGGPSTDPAESVAPAALLLPSVEDLMPPEHRRKPFWAHGKDMLGYTLNFTRSSMLSFDDTKSARSTDLVEMELSLDETRKFLDGCKKREIKLCAALTAAALIATASSKGLRSNKSEAYGAVTVIDSRRQLSKLPTDRDLGFYQTAVQNIHTVSSADTLWELAKRCHASLSDSLARNKHFVDMGDLNYMMSKAVLAPQLTPSGSMRTMVLTVYDEPVIYNSSDLYHGVGVEGYMACSSVHGIGPSIGLFDTIRDGRLTCMCLYPSPLHSRKRMMGVVAEMKRLLVAG